MDIGALAPICLKRGLDLPDLFRCLIGREAGAKPAVTIRGHAAQCRRAFTAKPDRHTLVGGWFWITDDTFEFDKLSPIGAARLGPHFAHDLDVLARPVPTPLKRYAQCLELFGKPADSGTEDETAAA